MRRFAMPVIVLLLTVILCLGPGCGKKAAEIVAERAMENAMAKDGKEADVNIDSKTGSMSIKSKDGNEDVDIEMDGKGMTIKSKEGETVSTVSSDGETYTMKTEGGQAMAFGKGAKVPDGFPKDIPIYPGAEIQMSSSDPGTKTFAVQALSADAIDKVAEYYKKEMKAQGWNEGDGVVQTGANPMHMLNFDKAGMSAMVMVMAQDGKALVSITTGQK
jgi:outer membrane lipoprotein-sorting protein